MRMSTKPVVEQFLKIPLFCFIMESKEESVRSLGCWEDVNLSEHGALRRTKDINQRDDITATDKHSR